MQAPPEPHKYVDLWPFGLVLRVSGSYFTYFWGPYISLKTKVHLQPSEASSLEESSNKYSPTIQVIAPSSLLAEKYDKMR